MDPVTTTTPAVPGSDAVGESVELENGGNLESNCVLRDFLARHQIEKHQHVVESREQHIWVL